MKKTALVSLFCVLTLSVFAQSGETKTKEESKQELNLEDIIRNIFKQTDKKTDNTINNKLNIEDGMYSKINTTKGDIMIQLEHEKPPLTVASFVGLAEGTMKNNKKEIGVPYYDGLKFHRVIADFMIKGGFPDGTGMGDPGYKFSDEFHSI